MFCTQCGTANPEEARFCRTCGATFSQPRQTTRQPATPTAQPYLSSTASPLPPAQAQPPYPGYQGFPVAQSGIIPQAAAMKSGASSRAIIAMVLSIASFFTCCLPLGAVGLVLGKMELTAIDEGRASQAGRTFAKVGFYLGAISTVIFAIGYVIGFLFA